MKISFPLWSFFAQAPESVAPRLAESGRDDRPYERPLRTVARDLVLKWEWQPGSTFYFVWQQNRTEEEALSRRISIGDMFSSPGARGDNFFAIEASFWLAP